jgi:hypothetical protein
MRDQYVPVSFSIKCVGGQTKTFEKKKKMGYFNYTYFGLKNKRRKGLG